MHSVSHFPPVKKENTLLAEIEREVAAGPNFLRSVPLLVPIIKRRCLEEPEAAGAGVLRSECKGVGTPEKPVMRRLRAKLSCNCENR